MGESIELCVLRDVPLLKINGEKVELPGILFDFFIYLAIENKPNYDRRELGKDLFGGYGTDHLRTNIIGRINKKLKKICLPDTGTNRKMVYDATHVRVDALEFVGLIKESRNYPVGSPEHESVLLQAYDLYQSDFLSGHEFSLKDEWQAEWREFFRHKFGTMMEALLQHYIFFGQFDRAVPCAEDWHKRQPRDNMPLQYLVWLSLKLVRNNDAAFYLKKLTQVTSADQPIMVGLSVERWREIIEKREFISLDLLGIPGSQINPPDMQFPGNDDFVFEADSRLEVMPDELDIPELVTQATQDIKLGYYDRARTRLDRAEALASTHGVREWMSEIYHRQGVLQISYGNYSEADDLLLRALEYPVRLPYMNNASMILANLGSSAFNRGQFADTAAYLRRSYLAADDAGQELVKGYSQRTLALVASQSGDRKQAFAYYQRALQIFKRTRSEPEIAATYLNLAQMMYAGNSPLVAAHYLAEGGKYVEKNSYPELQTMWYWYQGALKLSFRDLPAAEYALRIAMDIGRGIHHLGLQNNALMELGKVFMCRNDWKNAKKSFERVLVNSLMYRDSTSAARALYGSSLALLVEEYPAGCKSVDHALFHLRRQLSAEFLRTAATLHLDTGHLKIAEKVFEYGLDDFEDIGRYRINEALSHLVGKQKEWRAAQTRHS